MDDLAPFSGVNFFLIESLTRDSSRIHFFVVRKSVYDLLAKKSWLLFPESMLIKQALNKQLTSNVIIADIAERQIIAYKTNDGFKSVLKDGTDQLNKIAQYSAGQLDEAKKLTTQHYSALLLRSAFTLPRYCYQQAFNLPRFISLWKNVPIKFVAIACSLVFFTYLALSSAWLSYQQTRLSNEITQQKDQLEKVFSLQAAINKELAAQKQLAKIKNLSLITANVWPLLLELVEQNTELLSVNFENGEYTVRMRSKKSTTIMQFLSDNKSITTPIMASPVVKNRGKEIMTVRFSLINKNNKPTQSTSAKVAVLTEARRVSAS